MTQRRLLLARSIALGLLALDLKAIHAQPNWPQKPVHVIVPASPGSGPENIARLLSEALSRRLSVPVFVEGIPGAAGIIGTDKAMKAAPDGYTVLYGLSQFVTMNPHLYAKLPYDPAKGMAPISLIGRGGYVLIANNDLAASDLPSLIALARRDPGKLAYASTGNGSAAHLGMELLKTKTSMDLLHVPYKTGSTANTDLIAGQVQIKIEPSSSALPLVKAGRVKALAVTTARRLEQLPKVATIQETIRDFELSGWNALWAPAGTPPFVIARLNSEVQAILAEETFRRRLLELGMLPEGSSPAQLAALTAAESAQWKTLIDRAGIKAD